MAPARCEQNIQNPVTGKFEKTLIGVVETGKVETVGEYTIRGTEDGFTLRKEPEEHIEKMSWDDVDAHGLPENSVRITTPSGNIDITAIKK